MKKWLFISTLLLSCCLSLAVQATTQFEWRMIFYFAGKQRMLTQKMSKEILFIAKEINIEENKHNLRKTARLFDWTLKGLRNGERRLYLVKIDNPAIMQQLDTVAQLWEIFRLNVDDVLAGDTSLAVLKKVAEQNMPLLENMDKAVKLYENLSNLNLEPSRARVLNLTGKQRMLTQKMTKEFLLIANGIAPKENKVNMKKTMKLFERTLMGLLDGDAELGLPGTKNFAIRNQLSAVKKIWDRYKVVLNKSQVSQKDLLKVAQLNMLLLKEMNNAMKII